jgi:hypothetical protein
MDLDRLSLAATQAHRSCFRRLFRELKISRQDAKAQKKNGEGSGPGPTTTALKFCSVQPVQDRFCQHRPRALGQHRFSSMVKTDAPTLIPVFLGDLASWREIFLRSDLYRPTTPRHDVVEFIPIGPPKRSMLRREREFRRRLPADR